ncbi:unnamed protein product [Colias eurytheme]|nr:unnamed protein product [Colias eurytheme]
MIHALRLPVPAEPAPRPAVPGGPRRRRHVVQRAPRARRLLQKQGGQNRPLSHLRPDIRVLSPQGGGRRAKSSKDPHHRQPAERQK